MDQKIVDSIRLLSAEQIQKANSGHPGLPLGAAPMAYALWAKQMNHNPKNPDWVNRDRFVLSAGHGSALLYSMLHIFQYGLDMQDLNQFRQFGSKTPGHPESGHTVGVEISTGPLGQGIANAVGFAMAEAHLASRFNRKGFNIVDHYTYAITGDGCLMEGISYEAASLAGNLKLRKLILLYDSNNITIEGSTDITFNEDIELRFKSMGWDYFLVKDGNNIEEISGAIEKAKLTNCPSIIEIKTKIGYGCKSVEGSSKAHGAPLGEEGMKELYSFIEVDGRQPFTLSDDQIKYMDSVVNELGGTEKAWDELYFEYKERYPELCEEFEAALKGQLDSNIPMIEESSATRVSSGKVLNHLAGTSSNLIGGSADLGPSNNSYLKDESFMTASDYSARNIHFGIREHAMVAITNGMLAHGGLRTFSATFFVFSDYAKSAIRLAALMNLPNIFVLTHDSIGVGEDGPTHQPIEQLAMLRAIPNLSVIRPADSREVSIAYRLATESVDRPTAIILSRQTVPLLPNSSENAIMGGYIVKDFDDNMCKQVVIIATGSEVHLALEVAQFIKNLNIRVVSMPSMDIFDNQSKEYRNSILPDGVFKVSIEAASTFGWGKYADYSIGIDSFGMSAPAKYIFEHFGMTKEAIARKIEEFLSN